MEEVRIVCGKNKKVYAVDRTLILEVLYRLHSENIKENNIKKLIKKYKLNDEIFLKTCTKINACNK